MAYHGVIRVNFFDSGSILALRSNNRKQKDFRHASMSFMAAQSVNRLLEIIKDSSRADSMIIFASAASLPSVI